MPKGSWNDIFRSLEEKLRSEQLSPPPGRKWSRVRTLLEFISFCLDNVDCRFQLRELLDSFREKFRIALAPPDIKAELMKTLMKTMSEKEPELEPKHKGGGKRKVKVSNKLPL